MASALPPGIHKKLLSTKILEDNSTLLTIETEPPDSPNSLRMPVVEVMSFFAVQPSTDIVDAARTLPRVTSQQGVELIREIFSVQPPKAKKGRKDLSYTALMVLVRVYFRFHLRHEKLLPFILKEARKRFVRRRSFVHTMLEGSGCKVTLITGEKIIGVHIRKERVPAGITVFKGEKGFHSKIIEVFLRLDRVPSRHIQDYVAPDLPVVHRVGTRMDNSTLPVGFPAFTTGTTLVCGSSNSEVVSVLQQLICSLSTTSVPKQIFVIDTHNEFNSLINHFQVNPPKSVHLQVFRLGANIHLNLCDVMIPGSPSGKKQDLKARAAWKSHLISQMLLSSLHTSEYLTSRFAIPLETQIRKTAVNNHNFTLREVTHNIGGASEGNLQESSEGSELMFSDMMTIEAITGILEQLQAFPEVNYPSFTGHYSDTLTRERTITFFQFGAQPPLIRRATVGFLLHNLSQVMNDGCVVLSHAAEFLRHQSSNKYDRETKTSIVMDAYNALTPQNRLLLGSHRLQTLAKNMDTFDEIKNCIYLKMANDEDRELVFSRHELDFEQPTLKKTYTYKKQRFLGIEAGEGLLFREDVPQNVGFHFQLDYAYPIDLKPVSVPETKPRGSETLGLTPVKYESLMKLLKLLVYQPCRMDEALALVEGRKQGELSLNQFQNLGLFETQLEGGVTYCVITKKGRDYYKTQHAFVNSLPVPLTFEEIKLARQELDRFESFYDISASKTDRQETNGNVKHLVGRLLSYTRHLRVTSIPWMRIAEYHDLVLIESLEWQDFRHLFDLAHSLLNNLLLEITHLHQQQSKDAIQQSLQTSTIRASQEPKDLDDFLPDDNFSILQQLSRELGLDPYPKTGILDIYFAMQSQQRSLFEELKGIKKEKKNYTS